MPGVLRLLERLQSNRRGQIIDNVSIYGYKLMDSCPPTLRLDKTRSRHLQANDLPLARLVLEAHWSPHEPRFSNAKSRFDDHWGLGHSPLSLSRVVGDQRFRFPGSSGNRQSECRHCVDVRTSSIRSTIDSRRCDSVGQSDANATGEICDCQRGLAVDVAALAQRRKGN